MDGGHFKVTRLTQESSHETYSTRHFLLQSTQVRDYGCISGRHLVEQLITHTLFLTRYSLHVLLLIHIRMLVGCTCYYTFTVSWNDHDVMFV